MAAGLSSGARWAVWIGLAALLGVLAALFLEQRDPLEQRVLARAPRESSIVAYAELEPLRKSKVLGGVLREHLRESGGFSLVEPDIDAVAVAVGSKQIIGLAAGRFPLALVRVYLQENGAVCPAPLDERACSMPAGEGGGYLSIRALDGGLIGVTNGPRPDAADDLAARELSDGRLAAAAREALDGGALVWAWIDPRRLANTMSDPPEGWINLSLVARALLSAEWVTLDLKDRQGGQSIQATLEADCGSDADAGELAKVLESLNKLAATALNSSASQQNHAWARVLEEGFVVAASGSAVTARWSVPAELLRDWF